MSRHRSVLPDGWPRPSGYANGMAGTGEVLAVAGQIAWDEHRRIVSDDFVAQFRQALANVVAVVVAAGGIAEDIVSVTVYVVDKVEYTGSLGDVGRVWREVVGRHFPAMALVQVAGLVEDRAKVEIQALALLQPRSA
jgi:enamine deaminase RidA (YjgF/YER057c/UK114 family)